MIDVLLGFGLALLLVRGWLRGFVRESFDLLGLVVGILAAFRLSSPFGSILEALTGMPAVAGRIVAGALIFMSVGFAAALLAAWLHRVASLPGLNLINRAGGAGVAVGWGLVLATVVLSLLVVLPVPAVVADQLETSTVTRTLTDPEGVPQRVFHQVSGDRVVAHMLGLRRVVGSGQVVLEGEQRIDFAPVARDRLDVDEGAAGEVYRLLNSERLEAGLPPLVWSDVLAGVAGGHAAEMYEAGYFAHVSPVTGTAGDRVEASGVRPALVGENLALAADPDAVHRGLMNSPGHRANILDPRFSVVGVAVVEGPLGLMTVQLFGS